MSQRSGPRKEKTQIILNRSNMLINELFFVFLIFNLIEIIIEQKKQGIKYIQLSLRVN